MLPLIEEAPHLVEDGCGLLPNRHEDSTARIHRQMVRRVEFAGAEDSLPHALMNVPSFENFMMRLTGLPAIWPSATKNVAICPMTHRRSAEHVVPRRQCRALPSVISSFHRAELEHLVFCRP